VHEDRGAHFGAQTKIIYRHSREPAVFEISDNTFYYITLGYVGSLNWFTENRRVGGSIPPLVTTFSWSILDTCVTVYTGDMGNTFAAKPPRVTAAAPSSAI
jgi:hypothetical protein